MKRVGVPSHKRHPTGHVVARGAITEDIGTYRLEILKMRCHCGPTRPAKVLDVADDATDVLPRLDSLNQQPPNLGHLVRVIRRPRTQAACYFERGVVELVVRVGPNAGERGQ